jgi:dihydroorotase
MRGTIAQLAKKAQKVMLSLKNFLIILQTKEVFQMIPLPLHLLQNVNVSQEKVMTPQDWCNPVLQREIQNQLLLNQIC